MEKKTHQRQSISLETKIAILDRLGKGEGSTAIGKHFNLGEPTVRAIKKNEAAIRKSVISGTKLSTKFASYTRDVLLERTERVIAIWIEEQVQRRIPCCTTADEGGAKIFAEELAKIIEDGVYSADQVFNADKTGLYWKKLPNRTYIAKDEKTASGHKASKDRVTLLLCSNASGDRMLKPLLINKSLRPRALKGKDLKQLPVHWMANPKAWMTAAIFTEWFNNCFVPEVEAYMKEKSLDFKVLLIVDNAASHPELEHLNVQLVFLPPNTTSLIQFGLAIHQNDHQARRTFVEWAQNEIAVVPDFHKRILFSDEAHFWLNGYVTKQNCCIWSEANPQVYVETPLHPEKLIVWCALWAGGIIGPYFFKTDEGHNVTVNGDRYKAMITNFFIPELNNRDVQELWFQQDGATCHTARATIDLLKDTLGDRLISRFGPVNWPPRSCDLTLLDYFLWGYVKSLVYEDKPQTLDHLEDNIRRVIADIRPQMLEKVIENWTTSEPAVAVLCQKSYLKCNATKLSFE
ncbi:tigger transposable element-derived protein 1 [Trichonephila clavipes]|nr:tigger transposable element-derived protein 1 [Trichonephila clavipes]